MKVADLKKIETWVGKDKKKFVMTTVLFIAILLMSYGYYKQVKIIEDINENPCSYVETLQTMCFNNLQEDNIYNGSENKTEAERGTNSLLVNGTTFP